MQGLLLKQLSIARVLVVVLVVCCLYCLSERRIKWSLTLLKLEFNSNWTIVICMSGSSPYLGRSREGSYCRLWTVEQIRITKLWYYCGSKLVCQSFNPLQVPTSTMYVQYLGIHPPTPYYRGCSRASKPSQGAGYIQCLPILVSLLGRQPATSLHRLKETST